MSDDDLIRRGDALQLVEEYETIHDRISLLPAALPARGVGVKPLDLPNALKHAFLSGVVAAREIEAGEPCVGADLWVEYDPTGEAAYNRILAALAPTDAAQAPFRMEDMTLADLMRDPLYEEATTPAPDAAQAREAALDAIKMGFLSAAPGEWRVSDIERVTDAILRALEQEGR